MSIHLVIMRHAKAEAQGDSDQTRQLSARGKRDSIAAGRMLGEAGVAPELALVSTAARSQQTWSGVMRGLRIDLDPQVEEELYAGGAQDVIELLTTIDDSIGSVVVVGHNPAIELVSHALDDGTGTDQVRADRDRRYPTAAWSLFVAQIPWDHVHERSMTLTGFGVGRG
jgi:phosphohistidine phosphatase